MKIKRKVREQHGSLLVAIPVEIRELLGGLSYGDNMVFEIEGDKIILSKGEEKQ